MRNVFNNEFSSPISKILLSFLWINTQNPDLVNRVGGGYYRFTAQLALCHFLCLDLVCEPLLALVWGSSSKLATFFVFWVVPYHVFIGSTLKTSYCHLATFTRMPSIIVFAEWPTWHFVWTSFFSPGVTLFPEWSDQKLHLIFLLELRELQSLLNVHPDCPATCFSGPVLAHGAFALISSIAFALSTNSLKLVVSWATK